MGWFCLGASERCCGGWWGQERHGGAGGEGRGGEECPVYGTGRGGWLTCAALGLGTVTHRDAQSTSPGLQASRHLVIAAWAEAAADAAASVVEAGWAEVDSALAKSARQAVTRMVETRMLTVGYYKDVVILSRVVTCVGARDA